jgi:hypothetical protein
MSTLTLRGIIGFSAFDLPPLLVEAPENGGQAPRFPWVGGGYKGHAGVVCLLPLPVRDVKPAAIDECTCHLSNTSSVAALLVVTKAPTMDLLADRPDNPLRDSITRDRHVVHVDG